MFEKDPEMEKRSEEHNEALGTLTEWASEPGVDEETLQALVTEQQAAREQDGLAEYEARRAADAALNAIGDQERAQEDNDWRRNPDLHDE